VERPGKPEGLRVRRVPGQPPDAAWLRHPRLRRVSPISRFAAAAALEALGDDAALVSAGSLRLGIVYCVMAGCVNYSSRFYQEVRNDPATASPLVFPETVFNAPASHLAALLGTPAINYTHVGDDTAFVVGLATAAGWLHDDLVDGCLVIGAEEADWLTAEAMRLFSPATVLGEGAGAVYLRRQPSGVSLETITNQHGYVGRDGRMVAPCNVRKELEAGGDARHLIASSPRRNDRRQPETRAWRDWPGAALHPRELLGDAFNAASAWQVIVATEALRTGATDRVFVSVAGCNQAAIGVSLASVKPPI
jgi:3-Oxoacyl-[acyl-carrier-protein (ACP)] synthase III